MKKFYTLVKINLQSLVEYRGDLVIWTLASFITPIIGLTLWLTLSNAGVNLKLARQDLVVYFLLAALVEVLTGAWAGYFIGQQIMQGEFSKYLVKPYSFLLYNLSQNLAEKVYKITFVLLSILIILVFFIGDINLDSLFNGFLLFLFLVSLIMAIFTTFVLDCALGLLTFWFQEADFLRSYFFIISQILSGALIPITFFPHTLKQTLSFLPFRYFLSFPIEVLTNKLSNLELTIGFSVQIFWLLVIYLLYRSLFKRGIRIYQAYGS